jgi:hypothetical protein
MNLQLPLHRLLLWRPIRSRRSFNWLIIRSALSTIYLAPDPHDSSFWVLREVQPTQQQALTQMIHGSGDGIRSPNHVNMRPILYHLATVFGQCDAHGTAEPAREENETEHDAGFLGVVKHASVPESDIAHADRALGDGRLNWRCDLGVVLEDVFFDPATTVRALVFHVPSLCEPVQVSVLPLRAETSSR